MAEYNPSKIIKDGNTYNFRDTTKIPLAGTNALAGSIVPDTDNSYILGSSSYNFKNINVKLLSSSDDLNLYSSYDGNIAGSFLTLKKIDSTSSSGSFQLNAHTETQIVQFIGYPNGTLTWGSKNVAMQEDVIPRSGGAVITGGSIGRVDNNGELIFSGGTSWDAGAHLVVKSKNNGGIWALSAGDDTSRKYLTGSPNGTLTWDGQPIQYTSDQRLKQQINKIDTALLDAWEDVELSQFKYNDAVDQKGKDNARLHTGYVVQQINEACKSHNVDISQYGLYCHEEYAEETREVEHDDGTKTIEVVRPANEHYSLRYTEALIVECAYLRKCIKELRNEIEELKSSK